MGGGGIWREGLKRENIHLSLHCHHQNDSCIKMGNDESHYNVSLTARDKVSRQRPQTTTFLLDFTCFVSYCYTSTAVCSVLDGCQWIFFAAKVPNINFNPAEMHSNPL